VGATLEDSKTEKNEHVVDLSGHMWVEARDNDEWTPIEASYFEDDGTYPELSSKYFYIRIDAFPYNGSSLTDRTFEKYGAITMRHVDRAAASSRKAALKH
jgi:hypothetical protein